MENRFALAARARKVSAMVVYFDIEFARRLDIDPVRQAERVVAALLEMTPLQWAQHAILAGQRPPSSESQAAIIAVYVEREIEAENPASKRVVGAN